MMRKDGKIYVAGHRGLVGSALVRKLKAEGYENIVTRTHAELDLTRQADVERFFAQEKPDYVKLLLRTLCISTLLSRQMLCTPHSKTAWRNSVLWAAAAYTPG